MLNGVKGESSTLLQEVIGYTMWQYIEKVCWSESCSYLTLYELLLNTNTNYIMYWIIFIYG